MADVNIKMLIGEYERIAIIDKKHRRLSVETTFKALSGESGRMQWLDQLAIAMRHHGLILTKNGHFDRETMIYQTPFKYFRD